MCGTADVGGQIARDTDIVVDRVSSRWIPAKVMVSKMRYGAERERTGRKKTAGEGKKNCEEGRRDLMGAE